QHSWIVYMFFFFNIAKQAYPTNTDITFLAVTDEADPLEFLWDFGDSRPVRTTSRTIIKRYHNHIYKSCVVVELSSGLTSVTSATFPLLVQRAVQINRLVHRASVLQNQTVSMSCRVNVGTDLTYLWSFGDGASRPGRSTEQHVFHRVGEFRVEVTVSNLVSSASLSSHIFVVDRPCQPPPVKNMGPLKIQARRYEVIRLGVTYESEVDCDVSEGLHYTWTLYDSAGLAFPLPLIDSHKQSITLPSHFLHYDTYSAVARVQIVGSVVYSNYTVRVEVVPSPPVAFIQGGTNVFISNRNTTMVTLDGQRSYDPDFPMSPISYSWRCKPVSSIISSCFSQYSPTSSSVLMFPASFLKSNFDQFQFTLTVSSGERSASSETFLTVMPNLIRKVSVYCLQCQGDQLNWDQAFSVTAVCESCDASPEDVRYTWSLYLVNASSKPVIEEEPYRDPLEEFAPPKPLYPSSDPEYPPVVLDNGSIQYSAPFGDSDVISDFPIDSDSPVDSDYAFPILESGDTGGRPGVDGEGSGLGGDSGFDPGEDEGSNLVDSSISLVFQEPTLLDLPRHPVERSLFESYTDTGISSPLLSFRHFSLRPGSRYMLEVTAKSHNTFLGRSQLFLANSPAPKGITCQVQPNRGVEIHTHFSIFCSSGKEDLIYEYSFSIGNSPPRTLYQGRDFQYYFSLPAGDPDDDYKVIIYTAIRSGRFGTATKPCPVTVQVKLNTPLHPLTTSLDNKDYGLGNSVEIRNYISLLSRILNRLSMDASANTQAQTHTRSALICSTCELEISDQVNTHTHTGLQNITEGLAAPVGHAPHSPTGVDIKQSKVTISTSLMALHVAYRNQTSTIISGGFASIYVPDSLRQLLFVPNGGETEKRPRRPCVISLLSEFSHSPFSWATTPAQLSGPVVDLSLYKCSTRRKISVRSLLQPINIELQKSPRNHILLRSQINYHSFNITQQHLQQTIQLSVEFTPPPNKTFPIMLLFRMFERPTPDLYHLHRVHRWEGNTTRITLPTSFLNAAGVGYLALLNADFGKPSRHKQQSSWVGYSFTLESSLCLSWDGQQGAWTQHGCTTQQADTTAAVNCSCNQLTPVTVVQQQIQSCHDTADLDQLLSVASDLTVAGVLVLFLCLYTLGLVVCKRADTVSEKGQIVHYLPDNSPSDPHLYAVTIHTGLCSATNMSAKVYIKLHGENGFSQTKELQIPEGFPFRRNSQDTFILSTTESLGRLQGVHLWHDNTGPCPSWYLKQVEVSEFLFQVKGRAWLFLGQCWLSVSESDGQVERRLTVCTQGIGFAKLLHLKLSDYLADFHLWMSLYCRPSFSSFTHAQRLSVCLLLLLGYACVNTLLISQMDDQLTIELGLIDVSAVSVVTGVFSMLAVLPVATLISFLFRVREVRVMESKVKLELDSFEGECGIIFEMFSSSKVLLWIHSLFFSLLSCIFLIHPAMVNQLKHSKPDPNPACLILTARRRARYLRLVRPPTPAELKKTRGKKRKETLINKTLRDLTLCVPMLVLLLCVTYGGSFKDHFRLNNAVRKQFTRDHQNPFPAIQNHDDWWRWAQTSLLDSLYQRPSCFVFTAPQVSFIQETQVLIGEPVLWKTEMSNSPQCQVAHLMFSRPQLESNKSHTVSCQCPLLSLRSAAVSKLNILHSGGWLSRRTVALKVHITLYSPAPNLFTSVTLLTEQSPTGVLLPSVNVQSVRIYHTPSVWDYVVMICQVKTTTTTKQRKGCPLAGEELKGATMDIVIIVYYIYYICHSAMTLEAMDLLHRPDYRGHVDVSLLALWEQHIRTLRGVMLFLLSVKCVAVLGVNRAVAASATILTRSISSLIGPMISGVILLVALSCTGNLLFIQRSWAFSSLPCSLQTLLAHCQGLRTVRGLLLSGSDASSSLADFVYWGVVCLTSTAVLTAVVWRFLKSFCFEKIGHVFFLSVFQNYYLEEFESLVDELLFRLNALSNSLHGTLPPTEPQTSSRRPNCLLAQESASPKGAWTAGQLPSGGSMAQLIQSDVLENQTNQWTKTSDSCWFSKSVNRSLSKSGTDSHLGTHSEVVVEVLVHETPGSRETGNQQDP
uniref:Polycystic kidney disease 1b n=1 Tax=Myripristis murdjan TaxID=586833 RepID=A0A667XXN0_9TELE